MRFLKGTYGTKLLRHWRVVVIVVCPYLSVLCLSKRALKSDCLGVLIEIVCWYLYCVWLQVQLIEVLNAFTVHIFMTKKRFLSVCVWPGLLPVKRLFWECLSCVDWGAPYLLQNPLSCSSVGGLVCCHFFMFKCFIYPHSYLWPHISWLYSMPYLIIFICAKPLFRPIVLFYLTEDRASIRTIYLYCKLKLYF